MTRRDFLHYAGLGMAAAGLGGGAAWADERDELRRFRITEISGFRHVCPRPKFIGKNSHLDDHGDTTAEHCLRIVTDQGIEGVGVGNITPEVARSLVGTTLDRLWEPRRGAIGPIGRADHALFDLVGRALGVPAWRMMGGRGPARVPIYDGSIYFADLIPEHASRGVARILDEVDEGLERGQRAFKIKVGRGYKWMPKTEGFDRDVEVVRAVRSHVGDDVELMVDSNNGYDPAEALHFLDAIETELTFAEEMFPEDVDADLRFKEAIRDRGLKTLVADGESVGEFRDFDPYLEADALDVVQPDIRGLGLSLEWRLARRIEVLGSSARLAPHNWGSHLGVYMQAVLARGIPNFFMAEMDTSTSDLFDTSAFEFNDGYMTVPDVPGCGLVLREDVYDARYRSEAWTVEAS